jgi:hypothetical protein
MKNAIQKTNNWVANTIIWFVGVAFLYLLVHLSIIMHKYALGIYKIEREIQEIHLKLYEKPIGDKAIGP